MTNLHVRDEHRAECEIGSLQSLMIPRAGKHRYHCGCVKKNHGLKQFCCQCLIKNEQLKQM